MPAISKHYSKMQVTPIPCIFATIRIANFCYNLSCFYSLPI